MTQQTISYDHFEVVQHPDGSPWVLGKGAMGVTYKAFDKRLQCFVALKVIQSSLFTDHVAKERFLREARSAAAVHHPNVASVFYLGQAGEEVFYAMELVEGVSLEEELRSKGKMDPANALQFTIQISRALHALHRAGLVHRDIKPANIMLLNNGDGQVTAKLVDFGLAKSVSGVPSGATISMGGFLGTPYYASPEQINEEDVDTRSDIYSLGATLFAMLSGHPPFSGTLAVVLDRSMHEPPPLDLLPETLRGLLGKMLAKKPEDRFQNPQELRSSLEDALQQISSLPPTPFGGAAAPPAASEPAAVAPIAAAAPPANPPRPDGEGTPFSGACFSLLELLKKRRALPLAEAIVLLEAMAKSLDRMPPSDGQTVSRSLAHITIKGPNLSAANIADCTDIEVIFQPEPAPVADATMHARSSESQIKSRPQLLASLAYELLGGYYQAKERWTPVPALSAAGNAVLRQGMEDPRSFGTASEFVEALKPQQPRRHSGKQTRAPRKAIPQAFPGTSPLPQTQATGRPLWLYVAGAGACLAAIAIIAAGLFSFLRPSAPVAVTAGPSVIAQTEPSPTQVPSPEETKPAEDPSAPFLRAAEEARSNDDDAGMLENFAKALDASPGLEAPPKQMEMISAKLRSNAVKLTRRKFDQLRKPLEKAAAHNVVSAQVLLGENLRETEPHEALKWFTKAAANGQTEAMTQAGFMMSNGLGQAAPDFSAAVGWFQQGAAAGDADSMVALADCYRYGKGIERNEKKVVEILQSAVAHDNPEAMNMLGDMLKKGVPGFPPDYTQAAKLFASSMGLGYCAAQANLGVMYVNGQGVPKDPQKAFSLWKDGAENHSDPTCMFYYAYALEGGLTGEKKPAEARDWYKRAAKAGNGSAVDWCRRNNVSFSE